MKPIILFISLALLVGPASLLAELGATDSDHPTGDSSSETESVVTASLSPRLSAVRPFSRGKAAFGVSSLGPQFQFTTNINSHMNLRSTSSDLFWRKWITYGGFTSPATVNLLSNSTSVDFYPLANHGLRFSPGILIHNSGAATSPTQLAPIKGGSFTLNGHTYYSTYTPATNPDPRVPVVGPEPARALQELHLRKYAFTLTTGWGNIISRKKTSSWSFPVEAGVAFLGSPSVKARLIEGQICDAQLQNCQDAATNLQFKNDLQATFGGYSTRLDLLRTYPIVSVGIAYHYHRLTMSR